MNVYRHHIRLTDDMVVRRIAEVCECIYRDRLPLEVYTASGDVPLRDLHQVDWTPIKSGEMWGGRNQWRWFRTQVTIPATWAGLRVGLYFRLGHPSWRAQPEALVYINGEYRQGVDGNHHEILLTEAAHGGETYDVALRAWCTMFDEDLTALYQQIYWAGDLVQIDLPTRRLYHSLDVARGTAKATDPNRQEYHVIYNGLEAALKRLDLRQPRSESFYDSVPLAQSALDQVLETAAPLPANVLATGHAHIDVLWRWQLHHVREKAMHTFGTVIQLMQQYPDYHFTQSQPQLYQYVKHDAPKLYDAIKAMVKAGRWEPIGGMWVEADCNIPSGESLVRQFLMGRAFFHEEFGENSDSPVLWLPDTFGYSWALPQIIKRSGMKYFMTSKISWSQYNRLPYDSFWWRGIDGTPVLTHFLTAPDEPPWTGTTYNGTLKPQEMIGAWSRYQQKDAHDEVFATFGWGDGGGGPTIEALERAERSANHPALPHVTQGSTAGFFERLEADGDKLPDWNGELYLEFHRGTYTSQARNKRANRKSEVLMHRAELLASLASLVGQAYPQNRLHEAWRLILLHQFHDVIPGSSIREVYVDSLLDYETVAQISTAIIEESVAAIAKELALPDGSRGLLLIHAAGVPNRSALVTIPAAYIPDGMIPILDGQPLPVQRVEDRVYVAVDFAGAAWRVVTLVEGQSVPAETEVHATRHSLENTYLRVEFNELGEITRLYDKEQRRDVLAYGIVANQLQAFEDRPAKWDAWDIDITYPDKMWTAEPGSIVVAEQGALRATLEVHKTILGSLVVQRISLANNSRRLDFETRVDWHERHILLKVAFPVNILSPRATFDVQFGNVERPTHHNTSWDWARFESVGHKWANLSEGNYSVSLLNDCKYGHDIRDNVIRLSLLRAPTFPDPEADQGEQVFTYSLLPQHGDWTHDTIPEAHLLNDPVLVFPITGQGGSRLNADQAWFTVVSQYETPFVIVDTVKGAEDGRGLIVRLFETKHYRGDMTLNIGFPVVAVIETNLMENDEAPIHFSLSGNTTQVVLHFTPYQIRTLRIIPA